MNDRELLELAAKAAGIEVGRYDDGAGFNYPDTNAWWNPLTDDGDALRLAVKLRIEIRLGPHDAMAHQGFRRSHAESYGSDQYAATRRAIVRAAAEIGRVM